MGREEQRDTHMPDTQWPLHERFVLEILRQQHAIRLDHLPHFLSLFGEDEKDAQRVNVKSRAYNIVERLQRAGLLRIQRFGNHDPGWVWLTKGGLCHLGITSSWRRPLRSQ
ncbi:MAG TPA: hypothetical protein VKR06_20265, partial [Ktedonosporobacter sp.]|nr:hypothetical protein [Ktedonosporobacter sp.]